MYKLVVSLAKTTGSPYVPENVKPWQVFGIDPKTNRPTDAAGGGMSVEPARQTALSQRINAVLKQLRASRPNYQKCFAVRQGAHSGLSPPATQSWSNPSRATQACMAIISRC